MIETKRKPPKIRWNLKPNRVISMPIFYRSPNQRSFINLAFNDQRGKISVKSGVKLRDMFNWMLLAAEPKVGFEREIKWDNTEKRWKRRGEYKQVKWLLNFATMTFPIDVEEKLAMKCLNTFLTSCKWSFDMKMYVWKKEVTEANRIHFHLVTDKRMHYKNFRDKWNRILTRAGVKSEGNSTDIHACPTHDMRAAQEYLCKYVSKNEDGKEPVKGRVWGCSYDISRANQQAIIFDDWKDERAALHELRKTQVQPITRDERTFGCKYVWQLNENRQSLGTWLYEQYTEVLWNAKNGYYTHEHLFSDTWETIPDCKVSPLEDIRASQPTDLFPLL